MSTALSPAAQNVQNERITLQQDQKDISAHKGDTAYLSANIDKYQADYKSFQQDSAGLQNSKNGSDIQEAQADEAYAYDSFDASQADLKEALGSQQAQSGLASGDPSLTHLQSGVESLIDEGNANVLHLQAINNNVDQINRDTGIGIGPQLTVTGSNAGVSSNSQYGNADHGISVISGGTASPNAVAATANGIRAASGQQYDPGQVFGNTDG